MARIFAFLAIFLVGTGIVIGACGELHNARYLLVMGVILCVTVMLRATYDIVPAHSNRY